MVGLIFGLSRWGKCGSIAPGRGGSHPWRVQKSSNSRAKREAVVRWSAAAALSKAHANHATGELNEQQYTEKARELLGMIGRLRNALFHKSMA